MIDEAKSMDSTQRQHFRLRLIRWYRRHARDLPWRQTRDPYAIWISEVMLQQTQVVTVIPYYQTFLARFPDVGTLARARLRTVLRLWEGLGYYRRAQQLHAAAKQIMRDYQGQFPTGLQELCALPGIGRYTAGAILSLALGQRSAILEANTSRLWCRLLAIPEDPTAPGFSERLWSAAEDVLPSRGAGQVNQALMELGSQICRPVTPMCHVCPVSRHCQAFQLGLQEQLPRKQRTRTVDRVTEAAVIVRRRGRVLLRECQKNERWAGMWDFPRFQLPRSCGRNVAGELAAQVRLWAGCQVEIGDKLARLRHSVTRFDITLHCFEAAFVSNRRLPADCRWVALGDLARYPLNVTARRLSQQL